MLGPLSCTGSRLLVSRPSLVFVPLELKRDVFLLVLHPCFRTYAKYGDYSYAMQNAEVGKEGFVQ